MTLQEMMNEYNRLVTEDRRVRLEELQQLLSGNWSVNGQQIGGNGYNTHPPRWQSLEQMNAALSKQRAAKPSPPRPNTNVDPVTRRAEIEAELDIIRGRTPTPKGYRVDAGKIKALMTELAQLPKT